MLLYQMERTAASVHMAAAVPNFAWLEHRVTPTEDGKFLDADLFPQQCELEGAMLKVPEGPGLGVEFNEELAKEQEFKFWEAPHLHRHDVSRQYTTYVLDEQANQSSNIMIRRIVFLMIPL